MTHGAGVFHRADLSASATLLATNGFLSHFSAGRGVHGPPDCQFGQLVPCLISCLTLAQELISIRSHSHLYSRGDPRVGVGE